MDSSKDCPEFEGTVDSSEDCPEFEMTVDSSEDCPEFEVSMDSSEDCPACKWVSCKNEKRNGMLLSMSILHLISSSSNHP